MRNSLCVTLIFASALAACTCKKISNSSTLDGAIVHIAGIPKLAKAEGQSELHAAIATVLQHIAKIHKGMYLPLAEVTPESVQKLAGGPLENYQQVVSYVKKNHEALVESCHTDRGQIATIKAFLGRNIPVILHNQFGFFDKVVVLAGYSDKIASWSIIKPDQPDEDVKFDYLFEDAAQSATDDKKVDGSYYHFTVIYQKGAHQTDVNSCALLN